MKNWLSRLRITRVALVDKGANPDADLVLAKRDDDTKKAEHATMEECMAAEHDEEKCKELMAAMKRAEGDHMADQKLAEDVAKAQAEVADLKKRLDTEAEARKKAEADIQKMRDAEITKAFVTKAQGLSHLPGNEPAKFGPILQKMYAGLTEEEAKLADQILAGADNQLATSKLLEELGTGSGGFVGTVWEKMQKMAAQLIEKSGDGKLTEAQAMKRLSETNPEFRALEKQYDEEQREAARRVR